MLEVINSYEILTKFDSFSELITLETMKFIFNL